MSNEQIEDYFEDLATRFRPISHTPGLPRFCRFNIEEVVSKFNHNLDLTNWCLLLETPTGALEDNNADGYFDNQEIAFSIIKLVEQRDFKQEKKVLSESRSLGIQLVAKIIEEGKFVEIDENTVEYDKLLPLLGGCHGYRFTFTAVDSIAIVSNPADWI